MLVLHLIACLAGFGLGVIAGYSAKPKTTENDKIIVAGWDLSKFKPGQALYISNGNVEKVKIIEQVERR